jgi:hypothetical protein
MNVGRIAAFLVAAGTVLVSQTALAQNLLRNGSFEQTPCVTPCYQSRNVAPAEWLQGRDDRPAATYSNDGSYGYTPDAYGNFTGVTAQDGIRWVAVYSLYNEAFGQVLTKPLVPGATYTVSAFVRAAVRTDLTNPASVQFELWDSTAGTSAIVLGSFAMPIAATQNDWELRTLTFTAPAQAAAYPMLFFRALKLKHGEVYPGVDNVSLIEGTGQGGSCSGAGGGATIVINGCDTGVPNASTQGSCASGLVLACSTGAKNHGDYTGCVGHVTDNLVSLGVISGQQKGSIESCVARFGTP